VIGRPTTIKACQEEIDKLIDEKNALLRRCLAAEGAMKNGEVPEKYARLVEACKDFDLLCERDGWGDAPRDWRKVQCALAAVEGKR
jgi:hypothetical protein